MFDLVYSRQASNRLTNHYVHKNIINRHKYACYHNIVIFPSYLFVWRTVYFIMFQYSIKLVRKSLIEPCGRLLSSKISFVYTYTSVGTVLFTYS